MDKRKVATYLVLSLFLVSLVGVVSAEETIEIDPSAYSFWDNFVHTLQSTGLFTAAGQSRECSINADYTISGVTGHVSTLSLLSAANCPSDVALFNVYDKNWKYLSEHRSEDIAGFQIASSATYEDYPAIIEVYCCPYKACNSDSDCSSSPASQYGNFCNEAYGSCYGDAPSHVTQIFKCQNDQWMRYGTASYGEDNFCSDDSDNNYIDKSGGEHCRSSSYSSVTDGTWCGTTANTCYDGIKNGDETGIDCGGSCNTCNDKKGDIRIIDIEGTTESYLDDVSTFSITLKNFGDAIETINVEAGFYTNDYAKNVAGLFSTIPLFSATSTPNCNPAEEFVKTREVTLSPGEVETIDIGVVPYHAFSTLDIGTYNLDTDPLISFVGLYKECLGGYTNDAGTTGKWNEGDDSGMFWFDDYEISCTFRALGIGGADIWCGNEKMGECSVSTITIDKECTIPLTVDIINGTEVPEQFLTKDTFKNIKKIAFTKSDLSDMTTNDLLGSVCLENSECVSLDENIKSVKCIPLSQLREDGTITQSKQDSFFNNAGTIIKIGSYSAVGTATACLVAGYTTTGLFGLGVGAILASPAIIGGCAAMGGAIGATLTAATIDITNNDKLVQKLQANDADSVGFCVLDESFKFEQYTKWAAFFDITGDEGIDGLIIIIIGLLAIMVVFKR